jgi:hypothetical protein
VPAAVTAATESAPHYVSTFALRRGDVVVVVVVGGGGGKWQREVGATQESASSCTAAQFSSAAVRFSSWSLELQSPWICHDRNVQLWLSTTIRVIHPLQLLHLPLASQWPAPLASLDHVNNRS